MKAGLTAQQAELLEFIRGYIADKGFSPSYDEMMERLDLTSKSHAHRLVVALEQRGHIRRLPHQARSIELVGASLPDEVERQIAAHCARFRISRATFDHEAALSYMRGMP